MVAARPVIFVAGAAGAAATAVFMQPLGDNTEDSARADKARYEVCLKTEIPLFQNASAKCYDAQELLALLDQPVLDLQGKTVTLAMTHPSDATIPDRETRTCRDYREMAFDGWFAQTTRDMRREGYFVRACGALDALLNAQAPERSYFTGGSPEDEDMAALKGVLRIGEAGGDPERVAVAQPGQHQWRIAVDNQFVELQELANADFDNDGIEEILVFLAGGAEGGTVVFYDVGLIQKDMAGAAVTFTPLSYRQYETGGAAG